MTRVLSIALTALCVSMLQAATFSLTEAGHPKAQIVTGADAPETVQFAAKELKAYVQKISGAELPIAETPTFGTPSIRLGPAARDVLPAEALTDIQRDGYLITVVNGDLCIVGLDDTGPHTDIEALLAKGITHDVSAWAFNRGSLYGVYRLLEQFGVRWFLPGAFGERVPSEKTLTFSDTIRENPHFITRTVGYWSLGGVGGYNKKAQKITIMPGERDAIGFSPVENRMWELRMRGESFRIPLNHNPARTQWSQRFGAEHPEYFALLPDGTRDVAASGHSGHLCYTHPGVLANNIADIQAYAAGKDASERGIKTVFPFNRNWSYDIAFGRYYSVLPNDGFRACTCPSCLAKVPTDTPYYNQKHTQLVWDFVAQCAEAVPEMNIVCLAYGSSSIPYPSMPKLPPNVVVGFTAMTHPTSLYYKDSFQRWEALLTKWADLTHGNLAYWQHYLASNRNADNVGMPEHTPEMYARVARVMAQHGNHVFCEQMADSIMFEVFNRYLLLKLFYDPSLDERALFREYLERFYGPAGEGIGEIYADIEARNIAKVEARAGQIDYWTKIYSTDVLADYRNKANAAVAKAVGTPFAPAAEAFRDYYIGLMEVGFANFTATMGAALKASNPELKAVRAATAPVIDGKLDDAVWTDAQAAGLFDVDTGEPAALPTEVRFCYDDTHVYISVVAHDPEALKLRRVSDEPGMMDAIEVFLDTQHNHEGYYQMTFDLTGHLDERHYVDRIEPPRVDWRSQADWKYTVTDNAYCIEIALPKTSLDVAGSDLTQITWGVMVGRTVARFTAGEGRFSSTSSRLRRRFHQPDLFNTLIFTAP